MIKYTEKALSAVIHIMQHDFELPAIMRRSNGIQKKTSEKERPNFASKLHFTLSSLPFNVYHQLRKSGSRLWNGQAILDELDEVAVLKGFQTFETAAGISNMTPPLG